MDLKPGTKVLFKLRRMGHQQHEGANYQDGSQALPVSDKKLIAQELYYEKNRNQHFSKKPVHQRLGLKKQRKYQLFHHDDKKFIKPRIRKTREGLFTMNYAQNRLNYIRHSLRFRINNLNSHASGARFVHSVKNSCSSQIQEIIRIIQSGQPVFHEIDNLPICIGGFTKISLHARFSQYP